MKKIIFACALLFTSASFAIPLHDYNDITAALKNGTAIRLVTDFSQCHSEKFPIKGMNFAIFTPNEIGITNEHIATAFTHFTVSDPLFPGKPVYEFVRYTIKPDNKIDITLQIFDAATYEDLLKKDKISFDCKLDQGIKVYT